MNVPAANLQGVGAAEVFEDDRGRLTLVPWDSLPFTPMRGYVLNEIPPGACRGGHALRTQHRFLVCVSGMAALLLDDGLHTQERRFTSPATLHVPPRTWVRIRALDEKLCVLVLADGPYDPKEYVHERSRLSSA